MTAQHAKVRIDSTGRGTVELDGQPILGVRAVTVKTEVNCRPLLIIEVLAREVDLKQDGPQLAAEVTDASA